MRKENGFIWLLCLALTAGFSSHNQFLTSEVAQHQQWEKFLETAKIAASSQMGGADAVSKPWKLTLEKESVTRFGLWKNPTQKSFDEWRYEIAAYRIDRLIELNMVPPTVERRLKSKKGSLQLWLEGVSSLKNKTKAGESVPPGSQQSWNRAAFIQRVFDSLIANADRNANNILLTENWRVFLCDHSRSFRSTKEFTGTLLFGPHGTMKSPDGRPFLFRQLPRSLVEKIKGLDYEKIQQSAGAYLKKKEINAILSRRQLILNEIAALIEEHGEAAVLYDRP
jgi:hypothetical protein